MIDTGHGIRPEDRQKIFEPFERGHLPAANAVPGTGLGLTISKLLTEILGGEILVESTPGEGSVFRVRLLLSEAPVAGVTMQARRITAYAGVRRKILIADDDADHVRLVTDVLLPLGFIVLAASDGLGCLAMVEDAAPDLVILDISMPGMSGLEVAAELRARGTGVKILMVSGNLHDAAPHGVTDYDGFLAKPIDLRALLERIGTLLALEWVREVATPGLTPVVALPETVDLQELLRLARIGYVRGIEAKLAELEGEAPALTPFCLQMRGWLREFEMQKLTAYLEALPELQS